MESNESQNSRYALNWDTADSRLKNLKDFLLNAPQKMDPQRLQILGDVYEEFKGESCIYIRAKLLERMLTQKHIFFDGNPIVGTLTGIRAGVYTYPEWNVSWIKDEMDMAKMSSLGEVSIPKETEDLLKDSYKKWKGRTVTDRWYKLSKELYEIKAAPLFKSGLFYNAAMCCTGSGAADYSRVLNEGIAGILAEVDERLAVLPIKAANAEKMDFYRACKIALNAAVAFANRYADLAEETAKNETDQKVKAELEEIAEVCRRVPEYPARNFREAVQSFWFAHVIICIEQMGCGTSPGRYGQYMYPFYRKDVEENALTREQAKTLIKFQWIKHLELGVYQGRENALALSGHTGQSISIGGVTADGQDATTELDELLLDVQIDMKNIQPTLTLLYHPKMKESFLQKAVELIRSGIGQPQFLNNTIIVQRHLDRFSECGITLEDARNCCNFGCVSTGVAGKGSFVIEEHFLNLAKVVELVLYNGIDPTTKKKIGIETGNAEDIGTFEDFYECFKKQLSHILKINRVTSDLGNLEREQVVPSVFRSTLLDGCIEKGLSEEQGGPRYSQSLIILAGGIDTANSMLAIKHLVYDTKKVSMNYLLEALKANFVGFEDVQQMCFEAPKHGNDIPEVDAFTRQLYKDTDIIYRSYGPDFLGHSPRLDPYSVSWHNYFGSMMEALPNGRKKGIALTDGSVSAMPGTDVEGSTALIKSAANAIDTIRYGANHLNMKFLPSALEGNRGARLLLDLVKTYCDLGGSHIQFNCVSSETLLEAQTEPEKYKDLVVRVAGFSAYFTRLDKGVQDEIIKRTEYSK